MPAVNAVIEQALQAAGAVNKAVAVRVQVADAEKTAVTFTAAPLAVNPVSVTVCGLVVIAKVCPFTFNVPVDGGFT